MDGITVLNTYTHVIGDAILVAICAVIVLFIAWAAFTELNGNKKLFSFPIFAFGLLLILCVFEAYTDPIQYAEIMIDDDVPFNSVVERYEIEGKRGDIYTAIVRDDDE